jgi:CheY-like chemotaxis protein
MLQNMLEDMGCRGAAIATSVTEATGMVAAKLPDLCFPDISLHSEMSYTLATCLKANDVPFAFVTGFADNAVAPEWRAHARLDKPCSEEELLGMLTQLGF